MLGRLFAYDPGLSLSPPVKFAPASTDFTEHRAPIGGAADKDIQPTSCQLVPGLQPPAGPGESGDSTAGLDDRAVLVRVKGSLAGWHDDAHRDVLSRAI
jgi:hypothetical protein